MKTKKTKIDPTNNPAAKPSTVLLGDMFFTGDTIYTVLWDCRICTDTYLILEDAPENRANPYIVAIPLFEFKLKGSY